jgi:penicillin-binding protein 1A
MAKKTGSDRLKKSIRALWLTLLSFLIFFILFFIGVSIGILGPIPSFEELENPRSNLASEIYSYDGEVIGKFFIENRTNIEFSNLPDHLVNALIATEDIRFVRHSGVDVRGLVRAVTGAMTGRSGSGGGSTITQQLAKNLFERPKGLSKIRLISIKFREWVTAVKLERNYSKEEIITMYLNTVDFGSQAFGINSAAHTYFGKPPDSLHVEESAVLVGMLKAPTYYNPVRNPQNSMRRRNVVLLQMKKYGFLTTAEFDSLKLMPVNTERFQLQDHTAGMATYFREYIRLQMTAKEPLEKNFSSRQLYLEAKDQWDNNPLFGWCLKNKKPDGTHYNIYKDGLRIFTTIDSRMQRYAEQSVYEHISKDLQPAFYREWKGVRNAPWDPKMKQSDIDKLISVLIRRSNRYLSMKREGISEGEILKTFDVPVPMKVFSWNGEIDTVLTPRDSLVYYQWFLQAGFVAVDPQTGHVKAYVGGVNFRHFKYDGVTQAKRQVGSTFKPFVYALAVRDLRFSPCTKVPCVPVTIDLPDGKKWTPKNSGKVPEGEMVTLKSALAASINWISAYLIKQLSPQAVVNLARNMGIRSYVPPVYAIALGVSELTLMEMVGAQTTYPNRGIYTSPIVVTRIEDKSGNTIQTFLPAKHEALDEETAYVMVEMLKGVVDGGTGARIRSRYNIKYPIAGKTGTTDNNSDGWFMGITPDLVGGAWVGCQVMQVHFRSTAMGQGANTALPIWALFMQKVYADNRLKISKEDFAKPSGPLSIETDCSRYQQSSMMQNVNTTSFGIE